MEIQRSLENHAFVHVIQCKFGLQARDENSKNSSVFVRRTVPDGAKPGHMSSNESRRDPGNAQNLGSLLDREPGEVYQASTLAERSSTPKVSPKLHRGPVCPRPVKIESQASVKIDALS